MAAVVAGKHGDRGFPAYIGHLHPDGHCSVQAHWFKKDGETVTYSRPYPMVGGSQTCAKLEWLKAQKGAVTAAQ